MADAMGGENFENDGEDRTKNGGDQMETEHGLLPTEIAVATNVALTPDSRTNSNKIIEEEGG